MYVVGLTGGIGSGKSTVSALLSERGAVIVDADAIARELQQPGGALFQPMVDRFGPSVVASDGTLDRAAIAAIAFNDPQALADLNAITRPAIGAGITERIGAQAATDNIVILDLPLLFESNTLRSSVAKVIVVDAPVDVAVARLVSQRDMTEADARARMAAQVSREERLARADFVIDNSGSLAHLAAEVDRCWDWIQTVRASSD